eukprot:7768050-Alexandrium_andersonii.AAC.1
MAAVTHSSPERLPTASGPDHAIGAPPPTERLSFRRAAPSNVMRGPPREAGGQKPQGSSTANFCPGPQGL